ncbi:MAG: glycosyltransferase [Candidatus Limnocylindrales bacterium]|jgi:glycosyltransferase involved in cell wall biosynthesis
MPGGTQGRRADIALVHYTAPPVVGGVEKVVGRHASLMADAGWAVRIVAGRGAPTDPRVLFRPVPLADSQHPEIVRTGTELAAGRVPPWFGGLVGRVLTELEAALAGADIVVAHNVASLNQNMALTAALRIAAGRPAGPRFVLWHHDLAWTLPRYRPALHEGEPWSLLRTSWPGARQVTISESRRADLAALLGIGPDSIEVIPGGVDLPDEGGPALVDDPELAARLAGLRPLLLSPVRVTPRKNLELALRTVGALRQLGRPAGLVVTGPVDPHDATGRHYLESLLRLRHELQLDEMVFICAETEAGAASTETLGDLYREADALILPSWDEGFGLPILEAAVSRLPIVCSNLASLRELAGEAAVYVDPGGDASGVAQAVLEALARNPEAGAALDRRVRTTYSWASVYERHIAPLMERTLAEPRG